MNTEKGSHLSVVGSSNTATTSGGPSKETGKASASPAEKKKPARRGKGGGDGGKKDPPSTPEQPVVAEQAKTGGSGGDGKVPPVSGIKKFNEWFGSLGFLPRIAIWLTVFAFGLYVSNEIYIHYTKRTSEEIIPILKKQAEAFKEAKQAMNESLTPSGSGPSANSVTGVVFACSGIAENGPEFGNANAQSIKEGQTLNVDKGCMVAKFNGAVNTIVGNNYSINFDVPSVPGNIYRFGTFGNNNVTADEAKNFINRVPSQRIRIFVGDGGHLLIN